MDHHEAATARGLERERAKSAAPRVRHRLGLRARPRVARPRQARAEVRPLHRRHVGRAAESASTSRPISPATEQKLAEVAEANAQDVDAAVKAAREAYDKYWSKLRAAERAQVHLPHRPRAAGEGARARHRRDDGRRQADQGVARRRHPARRGALLLPRRLGRQARLRLPGPHARGRSASRARSSRGTSRCSWPRGRSRPRSRAATRWC